MRPLAWLCVILALLGLAYFVSHVAAFTYG